MSSCCLPQNNIYPSYPTTNRQQNEQYHRQLDVIENLIVEIDRDRNERINQLSAQITEAKVIADRLTPKITVEQKIKRKKEITSFRNYMLIALVVGSVALTILGFTCSNPFLAALIITSGVIPAVLTGMMIANLNDQINDIVI